MKVELIKTEGNKVSFKLTVDNDKFESAIVEAYNKNKGKYNIPGFRKGKAPRRVIETHYGKGVFYNDAIDILLPQVYPAAIDELKIDPIDMPSIDVEEISKDNGLVVLVDVEVKPEFQLGDYKGVGVEKVEETVNEDVVSAKLEEMKIGKFKAAKTKLAIITSFATLKITPKILSTTSTILINSINFIIIGLISI